MKKSIISKIMVGSISLTMLCSTGCGNGETGNAEKEGLPVEAFSTSVTLAEQEPEKIDAPMSDKALEAAASENKSSSETETTTSESSAESEFVVSDELLPETVNSVSDGAELNVILVGSNSIDITDCTISDFMERTSFSYQRGWISVYRGADFRFAGHGFSFPNEVYDEATGEMVANPEDERNTTLFIEIVDETLLKYSHNVSINKFDQYKITGVKASLDSVKEGEETLITFYGNIHVGSTKEQIEGIYGEGVINNNFVTDPEDQYYAGDECHYYKNDKCTMVVIYVNDENGNKIAKSIMLINNQESE